MTLGVWNFEDFPECPPIHRGAHVSSCFFAAKNLEEEEHLKVSAREMRR